MKYLSIAIGLFLITCTEAPDAKTQHQRPIVNTAATPEEFINLWNELLNQRDWDNLKQLYADEIYSYSKIKGKEEVIAAKRAYFEKNESFQQVVSNLSSTMIFYKTQEVFLDKTYLTSSGTEKTAMCFFNLIKNEKGFWEIKEETDIPTMRKTDATTNCSDFWYTLFKTSKPIKEYVAADYLLMMLEFRNDEIYVDVREEGEHDNPIIDRFTFSLKDNTLFQGFGQDFRDGKVVDYDRKLLRRLGEFCQ